MNFTTKMVLAFTTLVAIVLAFTYFSNNNSGQNYDSFAQCLTSKGMKMYGAFWCSHCEDQKKMFGDSMKYISYVECSTPDGQSQLPVCASAGIKSYPSWQLPGGVIQPGILSFRELSALSGCPIQ